MTAKITILCGVSLVVCMAIQTAVNGYWLCKIGSQMTTDNRQSAEATVKIQIIQGQANSDRDVGFPFTNSDISFISQRIVSLQNRCARLEKIIDERNGT